MFENLIGQSAGAQLASDIQGGVLAPAMLFRGPRASGKGAAGLELARGISCARGGAWDCACPDCARHRLLAHPDLLCLGSRPFQTEIAAAAAAFRREPGSPAARTLFVRALRKLLIRFDPTLWEGDPKASKAAPLAAAVAEGLDELPEVEAGAGAGARSGGKAGGGWGDGGKADDGLGGGAGGETGSGQPQAIDPKLERPIAALVRDALKLEAEGMAELIPIDQIRRAAFWSRLAPAGLRKTLLIENADRMREEAKNALLKLLEEPPGTVVIVLTSTRPSALLPTILSRLRPYQFTARTPAAEDEVIRRVFRAAVPAAVTAAVPASAPAAPPAGGGSRISAFLDGFLPVSGATLDALACFFAASVSAAAVARRRAGPDPAAGTGPLAGAIALGKRCAPLAEAAGLGRPVRDCREATTVTLKAADGFRSRALFARFTAALLTHVSACLRDGAVSPAFADRWREAALQAESAVTVYNQNPELALERLFVSLQAG